MPAVRRRRPGPDHRWARASSLNPSSAPRLGQPFADGAGKLQGALQRAAGLAELALPYLRDANALQDVRLPDGITEVADFRQRQLERLDGAGQLSRQQVSLTEPMEHLRLDPSASHGLDQPQRIRQQLLRGVVARRAPV